MSSVGATPDSTFAVTVVPAQRSSPRRVRWLSSKPAPPDTQEPSVIVISAATGELGRLVVDNLLHRVPADNIAVAVRNPAKAAQLAAAGVAIRYAD
jgi:hypothetical protein